MEDRKKKMKKIIAENIICSALHNRLVVKKIAFNIYYTRNTKYLYSPISIKWDFRKTFKFIRAIKLLLSFSIRVVRIMTQKQIHTNIIVSGFNSGGDNGSGTAQESVIGTCPTVRVVRRKIQSAGGIMFRIVVERHNSSD